MFELPGIHYPVALTRAAWLRRVAVPPGVECHDEAGRLWDVLWLLALAAQRGKGSWSGSRPCAAAATRASQS
jgi:hypothetical protein